MENAERALALMNSARIGQWPINVAWVSTQQVGARSSSSCSAFQALQYALWLPCVSQVCKVSFLTLSRDSYHQHV